MWDRGRWGNLQNDNMLYQWACSGNHRDTSENDNGQLILFHLLSAYDSCENILYQMCSFLTIFPEPNHSIGKCALCRRLTIYLRGLFMSMMTRNIYYNPGVVALWSNRSYSDQMRKYPQSLCTAIMVTNEFIKAVCSLVSRKFKSRSNLITGVK